MSGEENVELMEAFSGYLKSGKMLEDIATHYLMRGVGEYKVDSEVHKRLICGLKTVKVKVPKVDDLSETVNVVFFDKDDKFIGGFQFMIKCLGHLSKNCKYDNKKRKGSKV